MKIVKKIISAYQAWGKGTVWFHRPLFYLINLLIIAILFAAIVQVPVVVILKAVNMSEITMPNGKEILVLSTSMKALMAVSLMIVAVFSAAFAGLMRSLYRGGMYDNWWSMLGSFIAFATMILYLGHIVRQTSGALESVGGDTWLIIAFMTAWLLFLGYVAKVPWDEFRDRCAAYFERTWDFRFYWDDNRTKREGVGIVDPGGSTEKPHVPYHRS